MTIGELINELKKCKPDSKVYYDFAGLMPTTINSWRGTYDEPALGWAGLKYLCNWGLDNPPTVENLLKELDLALQLSYTGWKGGVYFYTEDSPLHIDNYGEWTCTELSRVENTGSSVILHTIRYDVFN